MDIEWKVSFLSRSGACNSIAFYLAASQSILLIWKVQVLIAIDRSGRSWVTQSWWHLVFLFSTSKRAPPPQPPPPFALMNGTRWACGKDFYNWQFSSLAEFLLQIKAFRVIYVSMEARSEQK
jgi:hypothetical protein